MGRRLDLQAVLLELCPRVYFQPPPDVQMEYECIRYERSKANVRHADNLPYHITQGYTVTVIDRDPDGTLRNLVAQLPYCEHDRFYTADNLNHDVFTLFF